MDRTNAERQRRYIANLKAGAAQARDSTSLRRENAALRQQIAALKQELAQQQSAARQHAADLPSTRELAMEAAKGMGARVSRLWSDYEAAEAKKNEAMHPAHRLKIPGWVPKEAWPEIEATWESPLLDETLRAALERLATDLRMRDVWRKLPLAEGGAELIIPFAVYALAMFPLLRQKPQSKNRAAWRRWEQHNRKLRAKHPHPLGGYDYLTIAGWACDLRDALIRIYFRGDAAMKNGFDGAIRVLDALFRCFVMMDEEHRGKLKIFPPVARWDDPQAPQRFFGQCMSEKMQQLYGRHFDPLVAMLTAVAFDLDDLEPETVRSWRRNTGK